MSVKSVYNFVSAPKENEVFKPDWADKVSHDIPFEDGESGEIEIEVTAKTPIFIRNGHSKKDAEHNTERFKEFSNVVRNGKNEYFIPGSSLKGMFRNVLEIMSLSRMKQIADNRYSYRDLSSAKNLYMTKYKEFDIKGGWLIEDKEGNWRIEECEDLAFIHHEELKKKGIPFRDLFFNEQPKQKTAEFKYKLVNRDLLKGRFKTYTKNLFGNVKRTMAVYDDNGKKGSLVFTGQSSKRAEPKDKKANGKVHEFVFFSSNNPNFLEVGEKMQKDFKFIYFDHDKQNISKDWKFWRSKLERGEKIPVFYAKNNNEVKHFGLAYMYKLPYEYSVKDLTDYNKNNGKDLADIIFGSIDFKNEELKGRVFVGHAFSVNAISSNKIEEEILASPKASYFPFYIEQTKNGSPYLTYEDKDAILNGYKRYYTQEKEWTGSYDEKQLNNKKVFSRFKPLKEGSVFKAIIRFHNLKKVEIGALLSSITFHGTHDKAFHSLGAAKPFGYGKIMMNNIKLNFLDKSISDYLFEFEKTMGLDWLNSESIKELLTIAQIPEYAAYPSIKDFVYYKQEKVKEFLPRYSKVVDENKISIISIIKQKEIEDNIDNLQITSKSLRKIKDQIKELGYSKKELPEKLKDKVESVISIAFVNHRETNRKLTKPFEQEYEWNTTISIWLGQDRAMELYNKVVAKQ